MCGLFGFYDYGGILTRKQRSCLLKNLSIASEERGTDATGIAYNHNGKLIVCKRPIPAHLMWYRVPVDAAVVMGHTRMTTQGSPLRNENNHPFQGKILDGRGNIAKFALAHNGILYNDKMLRKEFKLPGSRIETDSYVAVQLLEQHGRMDFEGLRAMAEELEGSFTITALTEQDELYFVKGNNPMCIYHYPAAKLYVYASTEEILKKAMLQAKLQLGKAEKVNLSSGEILRIDAKGKITRSHFDDSKLYSAYTLPWTHWGEYAPVRRPYEIDSEYLRDLKTVATCFGWFSEDVDALLEDGISPEEIEDMLYCY